MSKTLKTRITQKHDIEANWLLATNFTPMNGEIIIYDEDDNYDYKRIKIGNGTDNVNDLDFIKTTVDNVLLTTEQELTNEEVEQVHKNLNLENLATMEQVNAAIEAAIGAIQFQTYYTGNTDPDNSIGNDGDLYLVRG